MTNTRAIVCLLTLTAVTTLLTAGETQAMTLSPEQQVKLLAEAQSALDTAANMEEAQPEAARELYTQAAQKFQLLTETSRCDGELYRRLADAQLHSGQIGAAIASYSHAEQLLGPDPRVIAGLAQARLLRDHDESALVLPEMSFLDTCALWNRSLSLPGRFWIALAAWIGLWAALGVSIFTRPRAWRIAAATCGLAFVLLAGSLAWDLLPDWDRTRGVVTSPAATLRQGNGETFPAQMAVPVKDGTEFTLIERRGRWLRIALPDGNTGWLDLSQVELLPPRHTLWS